MKAYLKALTLAEILVVLFLIGVFAAETIPVLVKNYQKKVYVIQLKKAYTSLSQATNTLIAEEGFEPFGSTRTHDDMMNEYANYMKFVKACPAGETDRGECIHGSRIKDLHGEENSWEWWNYAAAISSDGMLYSFENKSEDCANSELLIDGENAKCGSVAVDVNGFKGPNVIGRDIFWILVSKKGILPEGSMYNNLPGRLGGYLDHPEACDPASSYYGWSGGFCFAKIILDGWEMNY